MNSWPADVVGAEARTSCGFVEVKQKWVGEEARECNAPLFPWLWLLVASGDNFDVLAALHLAGYPYDSHLVERWSDLLYWPLAYVRLLINPACRLFHRLKWQDMESHCPARVLVEKNERFRYHTLEHH